MRSLSRISFCIFLRILFASAVVFVMRTAIAFEGFGHNQTQSSDLLKSGQCTIGNYVLGCGVSNQITLATSPWLFVNYEAANIHIKFGHRDSDGDSRATLLSYFRTLPRSRPFLECKQDGDFFCPYQSSEIISLRRTSNPTSYQELEAYQSLVDGYSFEVAAINFIETHQFSDFSIVYGFKYSYFFNEDRPYSLRINPGTPDIKGQVDASLLLRIVTSPNSKLNLEAGLLAITAIYPAGHLGLSFQVDLNSIFVQLGVSFSWHLRQKPWEALAHVGQSSDEVFQDSRGAYYYGRYYQSSLHPEVVVQFLF